MRYLITGGAGFIGSHLCDALVERGDNVVCLDNLSTGRAGNLSGVQDHRNFRLVVGSVLDSALVDDLVAEADTVIHLAAAVGVKLVVDEPLKSMRTNIRGADNVLDAAHRAHKRVVVASTSEVYGKNSSPLHENADRVLGPTSVARWAYATAKSVDEILAFAYWRERQVPTVVVRLFNTVGPRQTGAYGMVLPRLVAQALLARELTVYGDGLQSRCFCHVNDVIRALLLLVDDPRATGEAWNIGTTEETTILDLADRVRRITGSASPVAHYSYDDVYGAQYEDMLRRVPDTTKIRSHFDWQPMYSLEEIIKDVARTAEEIGPEALLS